MEVIFEIIAEVITWVFADAIGEKMKINDKQSWKKHPFIMSVTLLLVIIVTLLVFAMLIGILFFFGYLWDLIF